VLEGNLTERAGESFEEFPGGDVPLVHLWHSLPLSFEAVDDVMPLHMRCEVLIQNEDGACPDRHCFS
jgi:hypothetical protein